MRLSALDVGARAVTSAERTIDVDHGARFGRVNTDRVPSTAEDCCARTQGDKNQAGSYESHGIFLSGKRKQTDSIRLHFTRWGKLDALPCRPLRQEETPRC